MTVMADVFDDLSFAFIVLMLLVLYDIRIELGIIRRKLKDGEQHG